MVVGGASAAAKVVSTILESTAPMAHATKVLIQVVVSMQLLLLLLELLLLLRGVVVRRRLHGGRGRGGDVASRVHQD